MIIPRIFQFKERRYENEFLKNLIDQSVNPPGGDLVMGTYYGVMKDLIQKDLEMHDFFSIVLANRKMPPAHLTNLLYRGIQYIELYIENNDDYPNSQKYLTETWWKQRALELHAKHGGILKEILLQNDTTTTIYQRYLGDKIILNAFMPEGKPLYIADFGCGGNYGLPGLVKNMPFNEFEDKTSGRVATQLSLKTLKIKEGLGIDRQDPVESAKWREACSFYPHELNGRQGIIDLRLFEDKIKGVSNVKFLKGDLLKLQINQKYDAVLLNTVLYQMNDIQRNKVLTTARQCLKKDGIIIVQDFAQKSRLNPKSLNFDISWFGKVGSYGTFVLCEKTKWKPLHIFKWGNARCISIEKGPDFNFLPKP